MARYTEQRAAVLRRIREAGAPSVRVISEETGIPKATIYQWIYQAKKNSRERLESGFGESMSKKKEKRASPSQKLAIVSEGVKLDGAELLAFCRNKGITVDELSIWRDQALKGLESYALGNLTISPEEFANLKADLERKNTALAEASALLLLQKKSFHILGLEK
jgi:transposase